MFSVMMQRHASGKMGMGRRTEDRETKVVYLDSGSWCLVTF